MSLHINSQVASSRVARRELRQSKLDGSIQFTSNGKPAKKRNVARFFNAVARGLRRAGCVGALEMDGPVTFPDGGCGRRCVNKLLR